jgi:hypothetical protein
LVTAKMVPARPTRVQLATLPPEPVRQRDKLIGFYFECREPHSATPFTTLRGHTRWIAAHGPGS